MRRAILSALLVAVLSAGAAIPVAAQPPVTSSGVIEGTVSTQAGSVRLPGTTVRVLDAVGNVLAEVVAEGDGTFRVPNLRDGTYRVIATLDGFDTVEGPAVLVAGHANSVALDLPISAVAERVEVVASPSTVSVATDLGTRGEVSSREVEETVSRGDGFQGALRLLASVIEVPTGLSIKGGRPSQAATQIGSGTLIDPSTGLVHVTLPADAIDTVSVLPNPYAVEFGRFSSGLVVIQTRRAGEQWKTRLGNLDPSVRMARYQQWKPIGLESIGPRFETGGPLIKDRLFLEQTGQFRYEQNDVMSRSEDERKTTLWLSTFSRFDANVSPRHFMTGTFGLFPSKRTWATLGTFTPPDATVDMRDRVIHWAGVERSLWTDQLISETTFQTDGYRTQAARQGDAPMQLRPETTLGNFYNQQRRNTRTMQVIETVTGSARAFGGLHIFKAGLDLLHSEYDGTSDSHPVLVETTDGRLVRRLDFGAPTAQFFDSTDIALFVQDRVQPTDHWYVEFGGRIDRDGVVQQLNVTPRVGSAFLLNESGTTILRGGFGLFFERTPSTAGAFEQFEGATDTRFAADGRTPLGPPITFTRKATIGLLTPRSATWDLAFDHRFNAQWSVHVGVLDRAGSHELVVSPLVTGTTGQWLLASDGQSHYRELEFTAHYSRNSAELNVSYVRSIARGDLNELAAFMDTVMKPVIGQNAYAPANADVPHRLFVRGRVNPTPTWLLTTVMDLRTGTPYSAVNEALDFTGPRNSLRFPDVFRLDIGFEHKFSNLKAKPWIGFRFYDALNSFNPMDVQNNISSPAFGSFYNSEIRQIRLQLRFER